MELLLATPCQLVINDPEAGHSLIAVFHDIVIKIPPTSEVPSNGVIPREWAIFSKWKLSPEEEGRTFSQVSEVLWPDGTLLVHNVLPATQPTAVNIAFIVRSSGFPIGQNGKVKISLSIEEDGTVVHEPVEIFVSVRLEKDLVA